MGPSIGLDPTGLSALAGALSPPVPPPPLPIESITAVLTPASSRLYAGQSVTDMTGFATFTAPGNFTSTAGGIAGVVVAPLGTAPDVASPLAEGDTAGYRVTVTDTAGSSRQFDTTLQTVEYDVRVISTSGNEVEVVLNDLVPDAESVDLDITHPPYTGLYAVMAGSLRQTNPLILPGTHRITHAGAASGLTAGDLLFMQDPLAHTIADSLFIPARAWLRNGTPISGATGTSHTLVVDDLGTDITPRATVVDNLGNQTVSDGATVSIPAGASGLAAPTSLSSGSVLAGAGNIAVIPVDDSALSAGHSVVIAVFAGQTSPSPGHQIPNGTMSSGETVIQDNVASPAGKTNAAIYRYQVGTPAAGKTFTIPSGVLLNQPAFYHVMSFPQAVTVHDADGMSIAGSQLATATLDTADNSVLVAVGGENRSGGNLWDFLFNGTPLGNQSTQIDVGNASMRTGFEDIVAGATGTTVVVDHLVGGGNFDGTVSAVNYKA